MRRVWLKDGRQPVNKPYLPSSLTKQNKELFSISKTPKLPSSGALFDGTLAEARPEQHRHNLTTSKVDLGNLLKPVVHSQVVTDNYRPHESYELQGVSLSKDQFNQLTNKSS